MNIIKYSLIFGSFCISCVSFGDDVVVESADVLQVHGVDPGLKTFLKDPRSSAVTVSLEPGVKVSVTAFDLFTDENKVNRDDGDKDPKDIQASVTLGAPVNQTLIFSGETVGEENVDAVPANIQAILLKDNPSTFELIQAAQWAAANPSLVGLAGGRGVVTWDNEETIDLGGGKSLTMKLEKAFCNEGMQFNGDGPTNSGTVQATLTLTAPDPEPPARLRVQVFALLGDEVKLSMEPQTGLSYQVERFDPVDEEWEAVGNASPGTGQLRDFPIQRGAGARNELFSIRETRNP